MIVVEFRNKFVDVICVHREGFKGFENGAQILLE